MKKFLSVIFIICLVLCSCGVNVTEESTAAADGTAEEVSSEEKTTGESTTEEATTEEVTTEEETTEEATEPYDDKIRNPLNGTVLERPFDGRLFAVAMNNRPDALPLSGISEADIFFEMLSDGYTTRGLALYSDIGSAGNIGAVASARYMFTELAAAYDLILCHGGATAGVLSDMRERDVQGLNADFDCGYRDTARELRGYDWEFTLFAKGNEIYNAARSAGYSLSGGDSYGLRFCDEGTPEKGSREGELNISFTLDGNTKETLMTYDSSVDRYIFSQYGEVMTDGSGLPVSFTNVLVLYMTAYTDGIYHRYDFSGNGSGYYACGGKSVPVKWEFKEGEGPFVLTNNNGSPLYIEKGTTYIALCVK